MSNRHWLLLILLLALFLGLRLWRLGYPPIPYFDERYYFEAARSILEHGQDPNFMHPPLGKELIASGMVVGRALATAMEHLGKAGEFIFGLGVRFWGGEGVGRRIASLTAGLLTLALVAVFSYALFRDRAVVFLSTFLLGFDFLHFVQSRIAMLDVFLGMFILAGYLAFWLHVRGPGRPRGWLLAAGVFFGLGLACKWSALFAMLPLPVLFWLWGEPEKVNRNQVDPLDESESAAREVAAVDDGPLTRRISLEEGQSWNPSAGEARFWRLAWRGSLFLLLLFFCYLLPYIPLALHGKGVDQVVAESRRVFSFHYPTNPKDFSHPYLSPFWAWPTLVRPIWYFYETHDFGSGEMVHGIIAIGSPWFWWSFIGFFLFIIPQVRAGQNRPLILLFFGYLAQLVGWGIDIKGGFAYYMYPMVGFMAIIVAWNLGNWMKAGRIGKVAVGLYLIGILGLFAWFFPLLSGLPVPHAWFDSLMWFPRNWI